jgi:hypothetical protein
VRLLQDCLLVRTRKLSLKVTDFLPVARAHQPEESLRTFMDPLADVVCCAAKRLKSSKTTFAERAFPDVRCIESFAIGLWVP